MTDWRTDAACLPFPAEWWFAEHGPDRAEAIRICRSCPVAQSCLEAALTAEGSTARHGRSGLYAGKTPAERARMPRPDLPDQDRCGTAARARAHERAGEPVDAACRAARNAYRRDRAAKKAAA